MGDGTGTDGQETVRIDRPHRLTYVKVTPAELDNSGIHDGRLSTVNVRGVDAQTRCEFSLHAVINPPRVAYIKIDTTPRREFLTQGSETHAEGALHVFARRLRQETGGQFDIHPSYGAVFGTQNSLLVPGFGSHREDDGLSMILFLNDCRHFDARLTHEAVAVGDTVYFPSPTADRFVAYLRAANRLNPNQSNRDQAILNGLEKPWDVEYARWNPPTVGKGLIGMVRRLLSSSTQRVPLAITLTQRNLAKLIQRLREGGFSAESVDRVSYEGITLAECKRSKIPPEKIDRLCMESWERLPLELLEH